MIRTTTTLCVALALTGTGLTAALLAPATANAQNQHMEIIHHPNYDKTVFMPFVPAIKIKSGKILWLAGTTALPVYHDHPHKRDQIQQYMVNDLEAQTRATMDGIKQTLDAAGASFKDVVHMFRVPRTAADGRHRQGSAVINSYFAPFNHKPTSTNVAVLELGEPEQLIEIQMFAVVDWNRRAGRAPLRLPWPAGRAPPGCAGSPRSRASVGRPLPNHRKTRPSCRAAPARPGPDRE